MKKIFRIVFVASLLATMMIATATTASAATYTDPTWNTKQIQANDIADKAREMGLPENDPIIVRAKQIWMEEQNKKPSYTDYDLKVMANTIYYEARDCSDRHQQLVGAVVMNRVRDPRFPNTVAGVVGQPGQYAGNYLNANPPISDRIYNNAKQALLYKVGCPTNVLYQANFRQGKGVYEVIE